MTIEIPYIFTWRGKEYIINIQGTSLADCTSQANALCNELAALTTSTSPSEGQQGNVSFEMDGYTDDDID